MFVTIFQFRPWLIINVWPWCARSALICSIIMIFQQCISSIQWKKWHSIWICYWWWFFWSWSWLFNSFWVSRFKANWFIDRFWRMRFHNGDFTSFFKIWMCCGYFSNDGFRLSIRLKNSVILKLNFCVFITRLKTINSYFVLILLFFEPSKFFESFLQFFMLLFEFMMKFCLTKYCK